MNLDVFAIGIVAETLFLLIVFDTYMVQSRFRRANGSVRLQKGQRCGFGHSERAYSRSGISCYANREPHVQVSLLVRCSKKRFAFRG